MDTSAFDQVARLIPLYRERLLAAGERVKEQVFDIRLCAGQPVTLWGREGAFFLREEGGTAQAPVEGVARTSPEELEEVFLQACGRSVFSHEAELREGYLGLEGGYRVGVCGTAVVEGDRVKSLRDITTLVFRVPRQEPGCGDGLFLRGVDFSKGLLVAGEPASGKTTLLRDVARSLSWGRFTPCRRVAVLDERGELGAFDLGPCADVLRGYPKSAGLDAALRALAPQFLFCDELGFRDLAAVERWSNAGVALAASVHAGREELERRPLCRALLRTGAFGTVVRLSGRARPGEVAGLERVEVAETPSGAREFRLLPWEGAG